MKTWLILAVLLACCGASAETRHRESRFVHQQGRYLVTADGKRLMLRGINLGNWLEPEGYMFKLEGGPQAPREIEEFFNELVGPDEAARFWKEYRAEYITEADIKAIRKEGFNSIRIPFHYKFFTGEPGATGGDGFALLDRVVKWSRDAGLYVVLDMHCAPGGQTGTNIDDSYGYPWLYESEAAQLRTIAIWRTIALHYRDDPTVLGYDLLNEPIPHFPALQQYNSKLEPLYRRITTAIREVDRNHVVIFGGAQWDSNFKVFGPPFDQNALYELHKYWMEPTQASIQEYVDFRERYDVPLWLGESGENTDEWVGKFTAVLEKNDIGWAFWPYKKMAATSSVVAFDKPIYWDEIVAFGAMKQGTGNAEKRIAARPSLEHSRAALRDLLVKIRFENEHVNPGYLKALGMRSP
ncbi:MAG TPA: cellulase family glycosylhydrolase [Acidisarcina sp.]